MSETTQEAIERLISDNDVVLFMKGTRQSPRCGFSASVIQILSDLGTPFEVVNVLKKPKIRDGIKEFSDWPTIPQLYARGEFIGGCDIIKGLYASGELAKTLAGLGSDAPRITVTAAAAAELQKALADAKGDEVRLSIDSRFNATLELAPPEPSDLVVHSNGLRILVSAGSSQQAQGLIIDFIKTIDGTGFKIDNPNAPAQVREISSHELRERLDSGEITELFDVRTEQERSIATIKGARLLDEATVAYIEALDKKTPIVFHCHHGYRSLSAAEHFRESGFLRVYNLTGGIEAWSTQVDSTVPRY